MAGTSTGRDGTPRLGVEGVSWKLTSGWGRGQPIGRVSVAVPRFLVDLQGDDGSFLQGAPLRFFRLWTPTLATPHRTPTSRPDPVPSGEPIPWWSLSVPEVQEQLGADSQGLTSGEARARLERYGPNTIQAEELEPWWSLALRQFRDPLIYILLVAAVVTLAVQHYVDTAVILVVVVLNALIGFVQEVRARDAVQALSKLSAPRAEVLREGKSIQIPAQELVPGDVVLLSTGARVPADLRLFRASGLEVDESALTGESVPVRKDPDRRFPGNPVAGDQLNLAFAATMVSRGRGRGLVIRTGGETEVGQIAEAIHSAGEVQTPLQRTVQDFGKQVALALVVLSGAAVVLGLVHGLSPTEIFLTAVAMAVSAVPEGLPVVLTVTLALGVHRMAGRRAIVRRLPAVETLGSTSVIASDKTGTLTRNEMTVRAIWAGGGTYRVEGGGYAPQGSFNRDGEEVDPERVRPLGETLRAGALANEADPAMVGDEGEPLGDPTEVALLVAAAKGGLLPASLRSAHPELDILPFEPELRYMAVLVQGETGPRIYMKGAPEAVLARCSRLLGPDGPETLDPGAVLGAAEELAGEGLRVLAMAYRDGAASLRGAEMEGGFVFCGLQGMEDPVRPEAVTAVAAVQRAGIRVLMLTGDHLSTARAIGRQLGLDGPERQAVEGKELADLGDEELDALLAGGVQVFARVAPEHKLRIVQRLRAMGEVVAVTGDGVNDAPALRAAHLGIAMGRGGTDVAREASDMILQDDNFATIQGAVEEGRVVFSNIRKVTFFLLSTAVGEVITILVALAAGWPLPFLAAQILWINLVTNGLQHVALAVEPGEPGLLDRKPRPKGEGILPWRLLERLGGVGLVLAAGTLWSFWWSYTGTGDLDAARTVAMTQMVVFQFFHVFNCRSLDRSIFRINLFSNRFLFLSIAAALVAQLSVLYWGPLQTVFRTVPLDAGSGG
jgi:magnesium-transporting ATPase (P-type)